MRAVPELMELPMRVMTSYPATMAVNTSAPLAVIISPAARAAGTATGPPWMTQESVVSVELWLNAAGPLARAAIGAGTLSPWTRSVDSEARLGPRATVAAAVPAGSFVAARARVTV